MKRAQSMAQAALSRPALGLSSWTCMGPRHRAAAVGANSNQKGKSPQSSGSKAETSEPFLISTQKITSSLETVEPPVSSSEGGCVSNSGIECFYSAELGLNNEVDADLHDDEDLMGPTTHEDRMTEVELWQQLEHELYNQTEGEDADVAKEIREEEAAAIAEVRESQPESSVPETKEVHRFFPPGKIMHIITLPSDEAEGESDKTNSGDTDNGQVVETKVGIFLTPRSLYSKLRLSQTMISDHLMPVYRRQIEKLIRELEKEETSITIKL